MTLPAWRYGTLGSTVLDARREPAAGRCDVKKETIGLLGLLILCVPVQALSSEDLELPFEIVQSAILVRALVDGKPVLLILDTGACQTVVSRELVRLAPRMVEQSRFSANGPGLLASGRYTEATLDLGGRVWRNRSIVGMNLEEVSKAYGRKVDGLLGQDILREFERVTIDYRGNRLLLTSSAAAR